MMTTTPSLVEALRKVQAIATDAPELNMSNFDTDQVSALNDAMIEIYNIVDEILAAHDATEGTVTLNLDDETLAAIDDLDGKHPDSAAIRKALAAFGEFAQGHPLIKAGREALAAHTPPGVPEPVYKEVERILDEHSAWIARPNDEVTKRVALAATVAAHRIIAEEPPDETPPDDAELAAIRERCERESRSGSRSIYAKARRDVPALLSRIDAERARAEKAEAENARLTRAWEAMSKRKAEAEAEAKKWFDLYQSVRTDAALEQKEPSR